ncbi:AAA family ATPase [Fundidesulfovibrio butyratiphilus]
MTAILEQTSQAQSPPMQHVPTTKTGFTPLSTQSPVWLQDIARFLPIRPQFVLTGNINDFYLVPCQNGFAPLSLRDALWTLLEVNGFQAMITYDRFDNFGVHPATREAVQAARAATGLDFKEDGTCERHLTTVPETIKRILGLRKDRVAVVFDYASRLVANPQSLSDNDNIFFGSMLKLSRSATPVLGADEKVRYNPIFWLLENVNELPSWLVVGNERIRQQAIQKPDYETRERAAAVLASALAGYEGTSEEKRLELLATFAAMTEGMTLLAMQSIVQMANDRGESFKEIADSVRAYKLGVTDNPWKKQNMRQRIESGDVNIGKRVKGQRQAITKTLDILRRSVMGLSGSQSSSSSMSGRPRGVLFFAGPTGVGKTELAKAITELLFDDDRAYIRFDMSEFAQEHTEARLIGAPPGYIGFDAGGELTKAVREKPFSVILFDEIEKAHPRILDKFLQILEDGRLTDSRGDTVYFSESIIIFTSNLGIYVEDETGRRQLNATPEMSYDEVENKIRHAIEDYFKYKLSRPEILNRIGDNIVVFSFIEKGVARQIFEKMLSNVAQRVFDVHHVRLEVSRDVMTLLEDFVLSDLGNGGRGIGNRLETCFINPLSRAMFALNLEGREKITATSLKIEDGVYCIEVS